MLRIKPWAAVAQNVNSAYCASRQLTTIKERLLNGKILKSDSATESGEDDLDSNAFGTAQSHHSEKEEEPAEPFSRPMPSIDPVHYQADDDKYCWVESFELDLNSKRHQKHICQLVISISFLCQSTN